MESEGWQPNIGMVALPSYLSLLRVPRETLQLRAARESTKRTKFRPQKGKSPIGPYNYEGTSALSAKFKYRGNIRRVRSLARPWRRSELNGKARRLFPVRGFWATIVGRTPTWGTSVP